ncbi:MAG: hypothetical protein ACKOEQ_12050, partial [Verrucomicrobiota bacterium]
MLAARWLCLFLAAVPGVAWGAATLEDDGYHVRPGDRIQEALDRAATNPLVKTVWVHPGEYRPESKRQALVWFNRRHDGVRLLGLPGATLSAANPSLSDPKDPSHPASVNHVIYLGDGLSTNTL